jgi:hypothetical protein
MAHVMQEWMIDHRTRLRDRHLPVPFVLGIAYPGTASALSQSSSWQSWWKKKRDTVSISDDEQ